MNHKQLLACVALSVLPTAAFALPTAFYSPSSPMSKGNWVRVGVQETGVYEITYDQLREMGFSNPASVAVYGGGGRQMPETFTDAAGVPLIYPDIPSVRVLHSDNKLFFYALGIEDIRFVENPDLEMGGSFMKNSRNIYSNYGYYFLTDSQAPSAVERSAASGDSETRSLSLGAGYVYHELDLRQNNTSTGQLYWGENYFTGPSLNTWDVDLYDLAGGKPGAMECKFYTSKGLNSGNYSDAEKIWLGYGVGTDIATGSAAAHFPVENQNNTADYIPQEPSLGQMTVPAGTDKVFVEYHIGHSRNWDLASLDHWVLSYPKNIPTLRDSKGARINQDLIAFPEMTEEGTAKFELNDPTGKTVWDVTDPANPRELPVTVSGGKGIVYVERTTATPVIAVFDRMSTQKRISGIELNWNRIANQNIHALQEEGCDMAIITLPWLLDASKKIAELHEREYGDRVVVVTADEVYNEFSGGVPDPMAYRSMVKMFYTSPGRQIKNLLLVGPLFGDFRGMNMPVDPNRGLIAFQSHELNLEINSMNANDILGMMTDYFNVLTIEKQKIHVGVGILPVYSHEELDRYVTKLEKFMTDESFAYRLTSSVHIGGIGDNHMHDNQAVEIAKLYDEVTMNTAVNTVIAIDAYGHEQSRNKWFETFNSGRHIASYFGHGAASYLGQDRLFFTSANVSQFRNSPLPFMTFFGCTISDCDHGIRGLGESMVFDTEHGIIGALLATRSTWSGQNFDFAKDLFRCFYISNPNATVPVPEPKSLTLGEIVAKAKNLCLFQNEMAYQLLADPGLIFPVALHKVNVTTPAYIAPNQTIKLSGTIAKVNSSSVDTEFNGEIVVRLFEPAMTIESKDLITSQYTSGQDPLSVTYSDEQAAMTAARVVNGKFEVEIHVPAWMPESNKREARLNFSAYNPKTRRGASGNRVVMVSSDYQTTRPVPDVTAPVIETLEYDPETKIVTVVATDNVALDLSRNMLIGAFQAYIDNEYSPEGSSAEPKILDGPRRYSREFYIGNLPSGQHSARVTVKDASGNKSEAEITFTVSPDAGRYVLAMKESGVADSCTFYVKGEGPKTGEIFIVDSNGAEVRKLAYTSGAEVTWNGKDASGKRLAPGRYRAYLRETGSHQTKGHSDVIILPVL